MKNAIILHGRPSKDKEYYNPEIASSSNKHWIPWLQKQLILNDIKADTPEVPHSYNPQWDLWVKEVERFEIGPETILVGHSCGGGFWVKYLSLHKNLKVGRVILVAPWLDPNKENENFFENFNIDQGLAKRTKGLVVFDSDDDMKTVHDSVRILREQIKDIQYKKFHNYGHFCYEDLKTEEFPELLEECLKS